MLCGNAGWKLVAVYGMDGECELYFYRKIFCAVFSGCFFGSSATDSIHVVCFRHLTAEFYGADPGADFLFTAHPVVDLLYDELYAHEPEIFTFPYENDQQQPGLFLFWKCHRTGDHQNNAVVPWRGISGMYGNLRGTDISEVQELSGVRRMVG